MMPPDLQLHESMQIKIKPVILQLQEDCKMVAFNLSNSQEHKYMQNRTIVQYSSQYTVPRFTNQVVLYDP